MRHVYGSARSYTITAAAADDPRGATLHPAGSTCRLAFCRCGDATTVQNRPRKYHCACTMLPGSRPHSLQIGLTFAQVHWSDPVLWSHALAAGTDGRLVGYGGMIRRLRPSATARCGARRTLRRQPQSDESEWRDSMLSLGGDDEPTPFPSWQSPSAGCAGS